MFSMHIDTAPSWRGGQNQVLLTVRGMQARKHQTTLVAHPAGELRHRAEKDVAVIPLVPRHELDLKIAWKLSRLIRKLRPDIVHAHDPHAVAIAALALLLGAPKPRPFLMASRRVDFHLKKNIFSRWKYKQVDGFVCASNAIREMLIGDGFPADRACLVHDGIDIQQLEAARPVDLHQELCLPKNALIVGNVAALVPHKGHRYLIDAMPSVLDKIPEARLVIVGQGQLESALRAQIKALNLETHVFLVGFRPNVLAFHKAFDIFVLCSITEGLGTSLLDAMAARRAIVATRAGGIPEVVTDKETGLLVSPRDKQELSLAIIRLLHDQELCARMGANGFARVCKYFSADQMVNSLLAAYNHLGCKDREADSSYPDEPA